MKIFRFSRNHFSFSLARTTSEAESEAFYSDIASNFPSYSCLEMIYKIDFYYVGRLKLLSFHFIRTTEIFPQSFVCLLVRWFDCKTRNHVKNHAQNKL